MEFSIQDLTEGICKKWGYSERDNDAVRGITESYINLKEYQLKKLWLFIQENYDLVTFPTVARINQLARKKKFKIFDKKKIVSTKSFLTCGSCGTEFGFNELYCTNEQCKKMTTDQPKYCGKCGYQFENFTVIKKEVDGKTINTKKWHVLTKCPEEGCKHPRNAAFVVRR